jgi:hypothetical protein
LFSCCKTDRAKEGDFTITPRSWSLLRWVSKGGKEGRGKKKRKEEEGRRGEGEGSGQEGG